MELVIFCAELQDGGIELDQHCLVLRPLHHGGEEDAARGDLVLDIVALAAAGVDHEGEGEGKIGALREVADILGFPVLLENEVVAGKTADRLARLVEHDRRDGYEPGLHPERGDGGKFLRGCRSQHGDRSYGGNQDEQKAGIEAHPG